VKIRDSRELTLQAQLKAQSLTCMAHFLQGYLDPKPNQKEAIDT
jgi:hypothetical protein